MWLKDTGILERVKLEVLTPAIQIPDQKVRHNQPLILRQLGIIMIILVIGLFMATIVFLLELLKKPKSLNASKVEGEIGRITTTNRKCTYLERTDLEA